MGVEDTLIDTDTELEKVTSAAVTERVKVEKGLEVELRVEVDMSEGEGVAEGLKLKPVELEGV